MSGLPSVARRSMAVAALAGAGCVTYRPVLPPQGDEARESSVLAQRLSSERIRVVAANDLLDAELVDVVEGLRLWGATLDEVAPTLTVELQQSWKSVDSDPLAVFTLGLLPSPGRIERTYQWRLVAEDGRQIAGDVAISAPRWLGWLVGPVALLPGWKLCWSSDGDEQEREEHSDARRMRLALGIARSVARLRRVE